MRSQNAVLQIRDFQNVQEDYEALAHIINAVWGEPTYSVDELKVLDEERRSPSCTAAFWQRLLARQWLVDHLNTTPSW
jgi:hypothetical protein